MATTSDGVVTAAANPFSYGPATFLILLFRIPHFLIPYSVFCIPRFTNSLATATQTVQPDMY